MILIIGNSTHLCEAIRLAYPDHEIKVIPWRSDFHEMAQVHSDLVFIVGFDYSSYMKSFADYMDINVTQPLLAVQRFAKPSADRVYISTQNGNRTYTFSRYRYAKENLGQALINQSTNSYVVRFDTFATSDHEPLVKGGVITKLIFSCLGKLGVVKTINMFTVSERLKTYKTFSSTDVRNVKGIWIALPRPQFIDRLMRLFVA